MPPPELEYVGLRKRVTDTISRAGGSIRSARSILFCPCASIMSEDNKDPNTFMAIKIDAGLSKAPAHYLAIPPTLFGMVVKGIGVAKSC